MACVRALGTHACAVAPSFTRRTPGWAAPWPPVSKRQDYRTPAPRGNRACIPLIRALRRPCAAPSDRAANAAAQRPLQTWPRYAALQTRPRNPALQTRVAYSPPRRAPTRPRVDALTGSAAPRVARGYGRLRGLRECGLLPPGADRLAAMPPSRPSLTLQRRPRHGPAGALWGG
ncbi:uncharacterized protein L3040_008818 [Drepanopeziza brunnea f. sp. 'multigermtubi']|uniref:uncharacterized protein n=1 Tax=Drepanopeziza brunnea f. sp. 'multigermtubi' TaxID=698441 RepID=UPI0023A2BDA7|nr:hypothetical protein L3040_008818 [Drepanopeziza brunnea f. sp. 'multigermtubi']